MAYDEALAERVRDLLTLREDLTERKMFGGVAWMVGGNMACGVIGEELIVRLDPEEAERALRGGTHEARSTSPAGPRRHGGRQPEGTSADDLAGLGRGRGRLRRVAAPEVARSPPGRTMRAWRTGWAGGRGWRERWQREPCSLPACGGGDGRGRFR